MNNVIGPPVEGDNFFGREKEIDYAWNRITTGNNLILPSPRRVGKTSFALRLLEEAKLNGWQVIHVNLEKITSEKEFLEMFLDELTKFSWWEHVKERGRLLMEMIKQIKPSLKFAGAELELEWQSQKQNIYKQLAEVLNHEEQTLIFFDELTVLLNAILENGEEGKGHVTMFLHWLRSLRIKPGSNIKWIYCSSVGIDNFTHEHGISDTMNDIGDYHLKSYSRDESIDMLLHLKGPSNITIDRKVAEAIAERLEYCLPFFLQLMFEKICYLVVVDNMPNDSAIVDIAYDLLINEKHFNTWIERIENQYPKRKQQVHVVLKHICGITEGVSRENLVNILAGAGSEDAEESARNLIYLLKNDGYLMEENHLYRFRSPLLRDFWYNRFVK